MRISFTLYKEKTQSGVLWRARFWDESAHKYAHKYAHSCSTFRLSGKFFLQSTSLFLTLKKVNARGSASAVSMV
jgi:hypothetical protein